MVRKYEELAGAHGRAVYHRPERHVVREALSRESVPQLGIGGRRFPIFDISANGVSFLASRESQWEVGRYVPVSVLVHAEQVFSGQGRIARLDVAGSSALVAVSLGRPFLDIGELIEVDEERRLDGELAADALTDVDRIPEDYLSAVNQACHFLNFYREALARHESRYRARGGQVAVDELAVRALEALRPRWRRIDERASEATHQLFAQPAVMRAAKVYTETVATPLFMESPMPARAYRKPRGYPGDYQVMNAYYDNRLEGPSVFAKLLHKFCVEHPLSSGCRTRKDWIIELMAREQRHFAAVSGGEVFHALSLGCGPAQEVPDFISRGRGWHGLINWSLLDQDDEALNVAYRGAARALRATPSNGSVSCLNISFTQLLNSPSILPELPPQQLIYSVGLFDYLREAKAQQLVAALYARLAPGGVLTVGNALGPNNHLWSAEMLLDWTLLYRTEREMWNLTSLLPPEADSAVSVEPGGAYYFLVVRRPSAEVG